MSAKFHLPFIYSSSINKDILHRNCQTMPAISCNRWKEAGESLVWE